jgi:hypothetical protein
MTFSKLAIDWEKIFAYIFRKQDKINVSYTHRLGIRSLNSKLLLIGMAGVINMASNCKAKEMNQASQKPSDTKLEEVNIKLPKGPIYNNAFFNATGVQYNIPFYEGLAQRELTILPEWAAVHPAHLEYEVGTNITEFSVEASHRSKTGIRGWRPMYRVRKEAIYKQMKSIAKSALPFHKQVEQQLKELGVDVQDYRNSPHILLGFQVLLIPYAEKQYVKPVAYNVGAKPEDPASVVVSVYQGDIKSFKIDNKPESFTTKQGTHMGQYIAPSGTNPDQPVAVHWNRTEKHLPSFCHLHMPLRQIAPLRTSSAKEGQESNQEVVSGFKLGPPLLFISYIYPIKDAKPGAQDAAKIAELLKGADENAIAHCSGN